MFIGHNNNLTMTVNGTTFALRTLTLQSSATSNRTFNASENGGISLSVGFTSDSTNSHTFNVPIWVDDTNVTFAINNGSVEFTQGFNLSANTAVITGAGDTTISGTISGSNGSLTKNGNGTLVLSGTNTYDGPTAVNAGMLVVDGNQSAANGNVTVFSGATLAGEGTVGGATTVSGTHAPGDGSAGDVGSQTFSGDLTYSSGSIFAWDLTSASTSSGFDQVTGATGKTFSSSAAFRVITDLDFAADTFWDTAQNWTTIFSGFGTLTGWASPTAAVVYDTSGTTRDVSSHGSFTINGTTLSWTPVPELSNLLVGALLGAGMMRRKRERV